MPIRYLEPARTLDAPARMFVQKVAEKFLQKIWIYAEVLTNRSSI